MRSLRRLPEPSVLGEKKERWLAAYIKKRRKSPGARPPSKQYGDPQVRKALAAMSSHKCFYCEQDVTIGGQVDHYIEVAERPDLAFEWTNLYLACPGCNQKLTNLNLPANECIDPCDQKVDATEHFTFDRDVIIAREGSPRGQATIRKYDLNRLDLKYQRSQVLQDIAMRLLEIQNVKDQEARSVLTAHLLDRLRSFAAPERPFSRMFEVLLEKTKLHGGPEAR